MALTPMNSDQNLFEEFDDVELSQIFEITSIKDVNVSGTEKTDDGSEESGSETVYIEPMDEENDDEEALNDTKSCSSQICTLNSSKVVLDEFVEEGRRSTGSHAYSRRSSIDSNHPDGVPVNNCLESYRDDELEYTSFDEDEEDLAMSMSLEEVATQVYDPEEVETTLIQDVTNYGDAELQVDIEKSVAEIGGVSGLDVEKDIIALNEPSTSKTSEVKISVDVSKVIEFDSQATDTSYGMPHIFNSTVSSIEDTEIAAPQEQDFDSQETIILSPRQTQFNNIDESKEVPEDSVKEPKSVENSIASTSKDTNAQESHVPIHLPIELTETRAISEDHDYLAKKLPMNFNLVVEDPEKLVQKNIDHVISLATSLKATHDKEKFTKHLTSLLNHISLLQDVTQIDNEQEQTSVTTVVPEKSPDSVPDPSISDLVVKEEYDMPSEDLENLVVQNMTNEISNPPNLIQADKEPMEVESSMDDTAKDAPESTNAAEGSASLEESLLIDPIRADIENLEKFAEDVGVQATQWRQTKETNLTKVQTVLKESDLEWRKLMLKFECPRDATDVGTEIDPKMFAKQNQRAKKDILAFMNDSESEDEELTSDNETRQNIISIVEASYSDSLDSDVEEEMGKKRIKQSESQLVDKELTRKDSENNSSGEDSDASIDRLCNLKNLGRKTRETDRKYQSIPSKKPEKKGLNIEELVNGVDDMEDGVESEEELVPPTKVPVTEAEFLKQVNEEIKRQLLESSESDMTDDESAISVNSEANDSEDDDSDSSIIMDRFLSSLDHSQKNAIKNGNKPPSMDSGLDEKSPPKTIDRRRSSVELEPPPTPESKEDDDDALDLSMFKVATQRVKEIEELADLDADLAPDTTESKVPNVEDYISLSSESEDETGGEAPVRSRHIRKIMSEAELANETKDAQEAEKRRIKRLEKMSSSMTQIMTQRPELESEFVLDYDQKNDQPITVHAEIVRRLKPHQKEGVKFMYQNCYGPINDIERYPGSGCILAHCMGLGKTLQLIALLHTVIRYPRLKTNKILVLCPKSTIMNWFEEFERWISKIKSTRKMKVFCFEENMSIKEKTKILNEWYSCGVVKNEKSLTKSDSWISKSNSGQAGCLLCGYETFRSLTTYNPRRKNARPMDEKEAKQILDTIDRCLIEPGADMVVCDEGHVIKNKKSGISKAVSQIKTKRRIILTGTPIQNNLNEYYCMVNWIKPSFLGTEKEFNNRYANPIKQGQHKDSNTGEIRQMKKRSFVLHKKLQPFVERKEFTILKDELPKKHEYVVYVPLTDVQKRLYKLYLDNLKSELGESEKIKGNHLLPDYTYLRKIWTHPRVLEFAFETSRANQGKKATKMLERNLDKLIERCDEEDLPDDVFDIAGHKPGVQEKWWENHLTKVDLDTLISSFKLQIMVEILRLCEQRGDKCLIFSNFVAVLSVVEFFLNRQMRYITGRDYYRLDGQTPKDRRHQMITRFNREDNKEVKCFLISARAGGQGINLIGANRVIILDTSWNPAADLQSIFRVYRLGQKKTCFVYRLLAMGTMEEKVYSRSVTKQAMSNRVVDEQQVDRHFSYGELAELYTLTEYNMEDRPVPDVPVDHILRSMLTFYPLSIYKYHEHDSLLASNDDEELTEAEKREAWNQFMLEEEQKANNINPQLQGNQMPMSPYSNDMMSVASMLNFANYGNMPNMNNMNNMLSQLMLNMQPDPYYGLVNQFSAQQQQQGGMPSNNMYGASPLLAMGNMSPLVNSMANLSGGGITTPSTSYPMGLGSPYRPPPTSNPPMYSSSTNDLITGMRQRSSNNSLSPFSGNQGGNSSARSHPVNGIARIPAGNAVSEPPVPVRLSTSSELQRAIPGASLAATNKRKQQIRPSNSRVAYEEQYLKSFENQNRPPAVVNKRKDGPSPSVIEIDDEDHPRANPNPPVKSPQNTGKIVKNANIGIHYPPSTQTKGTPIYLPDLPEGTSINKIPKKASPEASTSQQTKQNPATISAVPNKQMLQRPSSSSIRAPVQVAKPGSSFKPTQNVQGLGSNVTIIPTPRTSKPPAVMRIQQPPRVIPPSLSTASSSSNGPTSVKKVVQQITQNSRGNTSVTPVTRPSSIPTAASNLQGWKRKDPPTTNAPYPVKMIRLNPNLPPSRK